MIKSVQTLILEIAVPRGLVSDFYLMFHASLYNSEVNTALDLVEDRLRDVGSVTP